jgi:transposase
MSDLFWLTDAQMQRLKPFFPLSHGVPRVDDRRVLSGIIFINRNGLRWSDAPSAYGPHKTLYNRWVRWSRLGVFARILTELDLHRFRSGLVRAKLAAKGRTMRPTDNGRCFKVSTSGKGNCSDSSAAESVFKSLKAEPGQSPEACCGASGSPSRKINRLAADTRSGSAPPRNAVAGNAKGRACSAARMVSRGGTGRPQNSGTSASLPCRRDLAAKPGAFGTMER